MRTVEQTGVAAEESPGVARAGVSSRAVATVSPGAPDTGRMMQRKPRWPIEVSMVCGERAAGL